MENNTQVQNIPEQLTDEFINEFTDEKKKELYKEFAVELLSSMQSLKLIKRAYTFVNRLFIRDTGATLDRSPQAQERRELLKDINHYYEHIPTEQLTHIRNICYHMYTHYKQ